MKENPTSTPRRLRPSDAFAERMKAVRTSAKIAQTELSRRLADLGYELNRSAIADIESGRRRVTLDDALAISAALGVAPIHMLVPFEDPDPISAKAAKAGVFNPSTELSVGEALTLVPIEARLWISGKQIYPGADLGLWKRYYLDETPPAKRWHAREIRQAVREGRTPNVGPLPEDIEPRMAVPGLRKGLPTWAWIALQQEEDV